MNRVLVVSVSSLGDTVRALPVLHDIHHHYPDTQIDLLTNAHGLAMLANNPVVNEVYEVSTSRWALSKLLAWGGYWKQLRNQFSRLPTYDAVIDLHGTFAGTMSALAITGFCYGPAFGFARQPWVSFLYRKRSGWDGQSHAVEAQRELTAHLLGYSLTGAPHFLIERRKSHLPTRRNGQVWFITSAGRSNKTWPIAAWREVAHRLVDLGFEVVLPHQGDEAQAIADKIIVNIPNTKRLPPMPLSEIEQQMQTAVLVIGVDTGLTHLAAAHYLPLIAIFSVTQAWRYAPRFNPYCISLGDLGQEPSAGEVSAAALRLLRGNKL